METFPNYNSKRDHSSVILFGLDWSHNHSPSNPFICIHLSWPNAGSFWKDHSYNLAKSWPIVHSYIPFRPYLHIFTVYDKWLSYHTPVRLKIKGAWSKMCFPFNLPFLDFSWLFLGGWPGHTQKIQPGPISKHHFRCYNHCCWGTFRTHQRCTQDAPDNQTWLQRGVLLFNCCQKGWWGVSP